MDACGQVLKGDRPVGTPPTAMRVRAFIHGNRVRIDIPRPQRDTGGLCRDPHAMCVPHLGACICSDIVEIPVRTRQGKRWEIARRGRELIPHLPVLYISGHGSADWPSKGVPNSLYNCEQAIRVGPDYHRNIHAAGRGRLPWIPPEAEGSPLSSHPLEPDGG
jgi:hypothetical protein